MPRDRPPVLPPIDFLAVGHVTMDAAPDDAWVPGGAVTYAAVTARALGLRVGVVTRATRVVAQHPALDGVALHIVESPVTTTFENRYDPAGRRTQRVLAEAPPLSPDDVPKAWRRVKVAHFGPVMHEVGPEILDAITADVCGLAPQGWLRHQDPDGVVRHGTWLAPPGLLERADAVVLSAEDLEGAALGPQWFAARSRVLVLTAGGGSIQTFHDGSRSLTGALPAALVDPTGAGDTFAAALFVALAETGRLPYAVRFAAAAAAFKVEHRGPGGIPDRGAILARARMGPRRTGVR